MCLKGGKGKGRDLPNLYPLIRSIHNIPKEREL